MKTLILVLKPRDQAADRRRMGLIARARLSRRMRARAAAEGGFTLPELLTAMVILVIVITSLMSVLVSANNTQNQRTALITVADQSITITQEAPPPQSCASPISPSTQHFNVAGGTGSVSVTAANNCNWMFRGESSSSIQVVIGCTFETGCCGSTLQTTLRTASL